jgi:hypothetical protein
MVTPPNREMTMLDVLYLTFGLAFFALMILYAAATERM